jgi:hypothetical protein
LLALFFPVSGFSQYYNLGAFFRSQGCTGATYIQALSSGEVGTQSASVTLTPTSGHLLVALVIYQATPVAGTAGITVSVSDSLGNTWNAIPPVINNNYGNFNSQIWFSSGISGSSSDIITASSTQSHYPDMGLIVAEYSGFPASNVIDVQSGAYAPTSTTVINPGAVTATAGCDVAMMGTMDNYYLPTAGAGATARVSDGSFPFIFEDNLTTGSRAGSSVDLTANVSPADGLWVVSQAAFRVSNYVFNVPAPTKLAFTTSAITTTTWSCSPVTVQLQNSSSVAKNTETDVPLALSGGDVNYFSDSACTEPLSSATIWAGSNSQTIYAQFNGTSASVTVTPTGYSAISQTETVTVSPQTWVGGGSCNGTWSTGACWKSGTAPTSSQNAHFDGNCSTNCAATLGANVSIQKIWLHNGFTGSLSQSSYSIFTGFGGLQVDGGTFNLNTGTYGDYVGITLTGGTFNANSGNLEPYNYFVSSGGTFNPGTSTLNPGSNFTVSGYTPITFYAINCAVDSFQDDAAITVQTNLTIGSVCDFATFYFPLTIGGNWVNNGTYSNWYNGTDTVTFTAGANHTISGSNTFTSLFMDNSSVTTANTLTFTAGTTTTISTYSGGIVLKGNTTNNLVVTSSSTTKFTLTATATTAGSPIGNHLTVSYSKATNTQHTGASSSISNTTGWVSP